MSSKTCDEGLYLKFLGGTFENKFNSFPILDINNPAYGTFFYIYDILSNFERTSI